VDDSEQKNPDKGAEVSPAIRDLLKYRATGQSTRTGSGWPPEAERFLDDVAKLEAQRQADDYAEKAKGPERLIGPRNPDHPSVNNDAGGRDKS
jgi:hypothetical protein